MTTHTLSCLLLFICFLLLPAHTQAAVQPSAGMCFSTAGKMYQIDPLLLEAIARHESGLNPRARNLDNRNGTVDYGLMQVNSSHIPLLKQKGIIRSWQDLFDPCLNIQIGAWVLARHFQSCGVNWNCLGSYNAGFRSTMNQRREDYADNIYAIYRKLNLERRNMALR